MDKRLQETMDRLDKATVGPWVAFSSEICVEKEQSVGLRYPVVASAVGGREQWFNRTDADFIANAPTDIKFLLDALKQAQDRERVLRNALEIIALYRRATCYKKDEDKESDTYGEYVIFSGYEYLADGKTAYEALRVVGIELGREAHKEDKPND